MASQGELKRRDDLAALKLAGRTIISIDFGEAPSMIGSPPNAFLLGHDQEALSMKLDDGRTITIFGQGYGVDGGWFTFMEGHHVARSF